MASEPDKVGQEDEERESDASPEPAAGEVAARGSENEPGENARDIEDDGIFCFKPEAKHSADREKPARVFRLEKADYEVSGECPPEEIERSVLKFVTFEYLDWSKADGVSRRYLSEERTAEMFGDETGEDDNRGLREDRGKGAGRRSRRQKGRGRCAR